MFAKGLGILLLLGIVYGLLAVVFIPYELYQMAQARGWPARKAVVSTSYALSHRDGRHRRYWTAQVCGHALDNGERLCISRVRYGGWRFGGGQEAAERTAARYPVGSVIDIYYDPQDPRDRILEPQAPWTAMLAMLGIGVGFLLAALILWTRRSPPR